MMSSREELESLTRRELQALAKSHGVKASGANSAILEALIVLLAVQQEPDQVPAAEPQTEVTEQPEVDSATPAIEQQQQQQQQLAVGAEREVLVEGVWVQARVVRMNKKTVRVACGKDEYTVKLDELRIPVSHEQDHEEEEQYAELDLSLAAYEAHESEEPETIDWLAACCDDDVPSDKPAGKGKAGRQPKSITASMKVTKPAWNSTLKVSRESKARESKARESKVRKSSVLVATAPVAVPEEVHVFTATAAPVAAPAPAPAPAAATATTAEPTAARRKSFSASAANPTKTAPAIVPRLNKAAQLMLEARKKKVELERQLALSAPAPSGAFTFGAAPAPAMPVVHKAPAAVKKTIPAPSSSSSSSSSSASTSGSTSFKAKALPGFYNKIAAPSSASASSAENVNNSRPAPVSVKTTTVNAAAQKTARLSTFVQTGKDKRSSMMASKRASMAPAPPASAAAAAIAAATAAFGVQAFKPAAPEPLPVGPYGPFSTSLVGK